MIVALAKEHEKETIEGRVNGRIVIAKPFLSKIYVLHIPINSSALYLYKL